MDETEKKHYKAWDQFPDETDIAYDRFVKYLEMGPERSIRKVREKTGKSQGYDRHLYRWSSTYNWVERAGKYDNNLQRKALEGRQELIDAAKGRLLSKVDTALNELFAIIEGPDYMAAEGGVSLVSQKLKAIELTLKLAGVTPPATPPDEKPIPINNFIQNVYKKIERINNDED